MYEINGRIYEQHGEYQCYLDVWAAETESKVMLWNAYEAHLAAASDIESEHDLTMHLLLSVLSRIAQRRDRPLL